MVPLERLLNLLALLLEARLPLTFADIRSAIPAYQQDDVGTAKRMFERDKDALRDIGVPLEMAPTDVWEVEEGYVVDKDRYYLPEVSFTPEEVAALFVAAGGSADDEARAAFQKLSLGADADLLTRLASGPRVGAADASGPALGALSAALEAGKVVRFSYRRADGVQEERTVDPFGLVFRGGGWYLVGQDRDRGEVRAFRLSRFTASVRPGGAASPPPEGFRAADHVRVPGTEREGSARVAFSEKVGWWAASSVPGTTELRRRRDSKVKP